MLQIQSLRRFLLVLLLVNGLVPAFGELVEAVVHKVTVGHFAHDMGEEHDRGQPEDEHGCGTTSHLCRCCPTQPALSVTKVQNADVGQVSRRAFPPLNRPVTDGHIRAPFRPPIG